MGPKNFLSPKPPNELPTASSREDGRWGTGSVAHWVGLWLKSSMVASLGESGEREAVAGWEPGGRSVSTLVAL